MQIQRFTTTAARLAQPWTGPDVGRVLAQDTENGRFYLVVAQGTGANSMIAMAEQFGYVPINLNSWREADANGDVGAIAANGGILASDTTPILRGNAAETQEIAWAASNNDPITTSFAVPEDFDGTRASYLILRTVSAGTTNAASFTVESGWDGGALVSDTATGAASTTAADATATIAAADVPDTATSLTIAITPVAHTTDVTSILRSVLKYYRK